MPANLALRMRPKSIDEVIGQEHLVGPGRIIRRMIDANMLSSMISTVRQGLARPRLRPQLLARPSMPFGPLMPRRTTKNACRKSLKKLSFPVVWFSCSMKSTVSTRPNRTSCFLSWKMAISS